MRDCGIRRVAERQGLLLCWWMECREMIRRESLAGFQAHASLPDSEGSFTVLIRISDWFCVSHLCACHLRCVRCRRCRQLLMTSYARHGL